MKKLILFLLPLLLLACDPERNAEMTVTLDDDRGWMTQVDFETELDITKAVCVDSDTMRLHFFGWSLEEDSTFTLALPNDVSKFGQCYLRYTMCGWNNGPAEWDMTTMIKVKDKATGEWYELSRCITPYGGSFKSNWQKVFYLDVTPLMPLLEGETEFCIFYCGWDATEKRAHACALSLCYFSGKNPNGKPAWHQKIYDSTLNGNTGYRSWAYGVEGHSIEDSTRLGKRVIHVPSGTKNIVIRSCFTGHGQDALTVGNGLRDRATNPITWQSLITTNIALCSMAIRLRKRVISSRKIPITISKPAPISTTAAAGDRGSLAMCIIGRFAICPAIWA